MTQMLNVKPQFGEPDFYYTGKTLLRIVPTMELCVLTAKSHGNTVAQARNCVLGRVGCPDCPFLLKRNKNKL